jgi:heavy metal sensor kinase
MRQWWRRRRLRLRLTSWYVAAMIVVLGAYVAGVFVFVSRSMSQALDGRLRADYAWAVGMWEEQPNGTLTWFDTDGLLDEDNPWLQVWDSTGQLLYRTSVARRNPIPESASLARHADGSIVSIRTTNPPYRVLSRVVTLGGQQVVIQVAKAESLMRAESAELMLYLLFGLPFGVGAAGLGGYILARRALRPVDRMAERARSITAARLSDRLPVDEPNDELGRLATVFNETLGRLEGAFEEMRQFTGDVSHELRTPLTAIRTVGEVGLREIREPRNYRTTIESMLEEADRLSSLIDRLLLLSRAESRQVALASETVDLGELAREVAAHLDVLAEEKQQRIVVNETNPSKVLVDRLMLRQALINLVDNAIKYSPDGSEISVGVSKSAGRALLEVKDPGMGVEPERRARIFDRFYRDSSSGHRAGTGLGLAIAKRVVEINGGQLSCEERPGGGSIFRIALPAVDAPVGEPAPSLPVSAAHGRVLGPSRGLAHG